MCINNFKEGQGGGQCHENITLSIFQNCVMCKKHNLIVLVCYHRYNRWGDQCVDSTCKAFPWCQENQSNSVWFCGCCCWGKCPLFSTWFIFISSGIFASKFCPMERSCADKVQSELAHPKCRSICVVHSIHLMNACCDAPINVKSLV